MTTANWRYLRRGPATACWRLRPTPNSRPQLRTAPIAGAAQDLFDSGRAAIVANVGTLVQPTTLAQ
jgi:hypothetical protein